MKDKLANILWGLLLITVAILIGGRAFDLWEVSGFFPGWWTLFFIIPCLISMIRRGPGLLNVFFLLCGLLLLLEQNNVIAAELFGRILVPAFFLILGVFVLFHSLFVRERHRYRGTRSYSATFAGNVVTPQAGEPFQGCEADAVFGGLDLDLRAVSIENGAVIEAAAIFGGIDIKIPEGVNVKVRRMELFGGAKSHINNYGEQPVLYINALCMFGGVDIK